MHGVSQNIPELVAARDGALRSRQQMLQLIEGSPFAVAMFDRQLRYMVVSDGWRDAFVDEATTAGTLTEAFPAAPKQAGGAKSPGHGEVVSPTRTRLSDAGGTSAAGSAGRRAGATPRAIQERHLLCRRRTPLAERAREAESTPGG